MVDLRKHMAILRQQLMMSYGQPYCLLTAEPITPSKMADIHEAVFKRNRFGKSFQRDHVEDIFSVYNCSLLLHDAHLQWGQWKMTTQLHIWSKLVAGLDMALWVRAVPVIYKQEEESLINVLSEMYRRSEPLSLIDTRHKPFQEIIWPVGEPIWHYAGTIKSLLT
jgi:hypothetical protein